MIVASLSTIPDREHGLRAVVDAIVPQVDLLQVVLDGYDAEPPWLARKGVIISRSTDHGTAGSAAGKFAAGEGLSDDCYHLTIDDDLLFPADYVERMVAAVERHGRRALVGVHGSIYPPNIAETFPVGRRLVFYQRRLDRDALVREIGTGTLCYHTSTIRLTADMFRNLCPYANDPVLAVIAKQRNIPMVLLARAEGWLSPNWDACQVRALYQNTWNIPEKRACVQDLLAATDWPELPMPKVDKPPPGPPRTTAPSVRKPPQPLNTPLVRAASKPKPPQGMREVAPGMLIASGRPRKPRHWRSR